MAKTASQRQQEHVARLRRKAQAYDRLMVQLSAILEPENEDQAAVVWDQARPMVQMFVRGAEKAVQE